MDEDAEASADDKRVAVALSETVGLFVAAGWDAELATDCVEYVAYRFADLSSRASAIDVLRRDRAMSERLGVPPRSWAALLRIVLGNPAPRYSGTPMADGVLLRLLRGEPPECLHDDATLGDAIRAANPN